MKQLHAIFLAQAKPPTEDGYNYVRLKQDATKPIFPAYCMIVNRCVYVAVLHEPVPGLFYDFFGPLPELHEASA